MRNPDRIDGFCDRLKTMWHQVPDWRFGQLMSNLFGLFAAETRRDFFFTEDEELFAFFENYFHEV